MIVLAYHLVWTTYGTWLPGDVRGWIKPGAGGVQSPDPVLEQSARQLMVEEAVILTTEQRALVEQTIREHCHIRGWYLHALQVLPNHIHLVVTADCADRDVMKQLKAWCARKLSDHAGLKSKVARKAGRRHWFTEGGDKKWIKDEQYLENAIRYVMEGQ